MVELWQALGLGGFAALVRYAQQFTVAKDLRPEWEWGVASIHASTGAFVGLLSSFAIGTTWEIRYAHVAVALAGYGGPLTLDWGWKAVTELGQSFFNRAAQNAKDKDAKG